MLTRRSFLPLLAAPAVLKLGVYMPVSSAKLVVPEPKFWKKSLYGTVPDYEGYYRHLVSGGTVFTAASGGPGYPHLDFNVLYADGKPDQWWLNPSSSQTSGSSAA